MTQICLTYTNQAKNCVNNSLPKHSPYVLKKGNVCGKQRRHDDILIFENLALISSQRPGKVARRNLGFNLFTFMFENLTQNRRHQIKQGRWSYVWLKQTNTKELNADPLSLVTSGFSSVQQFIVNQVKNIDKLY